MGTERAALRRVNDWLLRINDVDLINKDKKQALKALLHGEGAINMVVRRRKSLGGKVVTPLHISLSGQKGSGWWPGQGLPTAGAPPCVSGALHSRAEVLMLLECSPCAPPDVGPLGPGSCLSEALPTAHVPELLGGLAWGALGWTGAS